jgi:hypothetical protein
MSVIFAITIRHIDFNSRNGLRFLLAGGSVTLSQNGSVVRAF